MTQINAKVVNKIYDAVKQESESFKGKGSNGYTVELNKTGIFGQAFGGVTIYGGKGKRQGPYMGSFCSNGKVVSAAINQYIEDLSGEVKKLYKEAAFSLWKDFRQKSQLSTVTEDMLKEYLGSKTDYLVQKGYGKLLTSLLDMKKGMDLVKSISSVKKAEDALQFIQSGDMKELYQSITKLSYTDKEITDTAVKNALEGIESARKNLESALYDYLYNDNTYDSMNMGEKMKFFWKSVFQCPVDVEVYDENKKLIGSVIDGAVTYTDGIYIELNGDVKTVYIPKDRKVHYKLTGTDDGSMNYMLEEYQNGSSAGRLNYYDVPLSKGVEYGQALETAGISDDVDSIPLIAASIMSKKLAAGADAIVLDVKTGSGAFMKRQEDAYALAEEMVRIGQNAGRNTVAVISDMDQPLGNMVGNALEVKEAIDTLLGKGAEDFTELCYTLGSYMLMMGGKAESEEQGKEMLKKVIEDGSALNKLAEFVKAQGGDERMVYNPELLPKARLIEPVCAPKDGWVNKLVCDQVGICSLLLGGGRETKESEVLAYLYANDRVKLGAAKERLLDAYHIGGEEKKTNSIIIEVVKQV